MKKMTLVAGVMAALSIGLVRDTDAGYKYPHTVSVNTSLSYAAGTLSDVRNTADTVQWIGCKVDRYANGTGSGYCWARNAAGTHVNCFTDEPALLDVMADVNGDTHVWFYWNAASDCTKIALTNSSQYAPKL